MPSFTLYAFGWPSAPRDGFTDDELCSYLNVRYPPTVKSARSRLSRAGYLRDSGVRRDSARGRPSIVWVRS